MSGFQSGGGRGGGRDGPSRGGNGGRDGGGRGRGDGGGGGRGDGGGLTGRNRHMGEVQSVAASNAPQTPGMTDVEILKIISPPLADRNRSALVNPMAGPYGDSSVVLPTPAGWRHTGARIGKVLDQKNQIVRSNYFLLTPPSGKSRPTTIYHYNVNIYSIGKDGRVSSENMSNIIESQESTTLILSFRKSHPEWPTSGGFAYDGKANIFTTELLPLPSKSPADEPFIAEDTPLNKPDGTISRQVFRVTLTLVQQIPFPSDYSAIDARGLLALELAIIAFAKWQVVADLPDWFLVGSQVFKSSGQTFPLSPAFVAMRGFKLGLRSIRSGLALVSDMVVNVFLSGGEMITVMCFASGCRNLEEFLSDCKRGLHPSVLARIENAIGSCKCVLKYLDRQLRKAKFLGPAANSPASKFESEGKTMTVADYFTMMCADKVKGKAYKTALPNGKLKYPEIPTINIGSIAKPILIPPELMMIPKGQCRLQVSDPEVSAKHIRYSAVRPDERMKYIFDTTAEGNIIKLLKADPTTTAFGLNGISSIGLSVGAILLPSPRLQYGKGQVLEPKLSGTWNAEGRQVFLSAATFFRGAEVPFAVMLCSSGSRPPRPDYEQVVLGFIADMEKDAQILGIKIKMQKTMIKCSPDPKELEAKFKMCQSIGVGFVFCIMIDTDIYGAMKLQADQLGLITQCLKWKNVDRPPKSFHFNVMLKVNTKLGGTNHTLVSRLPAGAKAAPGSFQSPPQSLSWIFDKPCMLIGIDVSHPELGSRKDSAAAVVASMDGMCSQYAAYLTMQNPNEEMVLGLEDAMVHLLKLFQAKNNGKMPEIIVLYRDGVSDGQFDKVVQIEIPAIKGAYACMGFDPNSVKISAVICQKRHNTKLAFEEAGTGEFINTCPGLLVDSTSVNSICNPSINEFFLNSHVAIQGTSKACKYALIYDEVGFKMSELELLTYWLTYLYCRCNKSVSYATPAYYAHWASRRGKYLFAAGARNEELVSISKVFGDPKRKAIMFYV